MRITIIVLSLFGLLIATTLLTSCDRLFPPGTTWSYTLKEVNGNATIDMDGVTIVFEGEQISGSASGDLQVSGSVISSGSVGLGGRIFSRKYSNGVNTMRFDMYHFKLFDEGNKLSIQGTDVDLSRGKKVVTVKKDGSVKVEDI